MQERSRTRPVINHGVKRGGHQSSVPRFSVSPPRATRAARRGSGSRAIRQQSAPLQIVRTGVAVRAWTVRGPTALRAGLGFGIDVHRAVRIHVQHFFRTVCDARSVPCTARLAIVTSSHTTGVFSTETCFAHRHRDDLVGACSHWWIAGPRIHRMTLQHDLFPSDRHLEGLPFRDNVRTN